MSSDEIVHKEKVEPYSESKDKSGYVVLPSAKGGGGIGDVDASGLQDSGFNPHAPMEQIIDPDGPNPKRVTIYDAKRMNPDMTPKPVEKVAAPPISAKPPREPKKPKVVKMEASPAVVETNKTNQKVYLHVAGAKIPFYVSEVHVDVATSMFALVLNTKDKLGEIPEFSTTQDDEYITLSLADSDTVYYCGFYGQQLTIGSGINAIRVVFMILLSTDDSK